jgi:ubiquinone/menaquinone biosynthesis C-methylase UbiE
VWTPPEHGECWLDIGCGAGTYSRFLADEGLRVIGLDYSLPALLKARKRSSRAIEWISGDVSSLPIRPATLDGALCFGVLQAIAQSRPALQSIANAMKPSAKLWIDILNAQCVPNRIETARLRRAGKPVHLRYETAEAFSDALCDSGFEIVSMHWIPILPMRFRRLQPLIERRAARWLLRRSGWIAPLISHSLLIEARLLEKPEPRQ